MLLPLTDGLVRTWAADPDCARLADRHYSRGRIGAQQFAPSGRKLVLRDTAGLVAFVWLFPDPQYRADKQVGINCTLFRNESERRSSEIILEAEAAAVGFQVGVQLPVEIARHPRLIFPDAVSKVALPDAGGLHPGLDSVTGLLVERRGHRNQDRLTRM